MAEQTPGPWRVNPVTLGDTSGNEPVDAGFEIVAHCEGFSDPRVLAMTALVQADDPTGWLATDEANCRLMAQAPRLLAALRSAVKIADEIRDEWDAAPNGMKAGKLLIALSGRLHGYRFDIDEIHAAIAAAEGEG